MGVTGWKDTKPPAARHVIILLNDSTQKRFLVILGKARRTLCTPRFKLSQTDGILDVHYFLVNHGTCPSHIARTYITVCFSPPDIRTPVPAKLTSALKEPRSQPPYETARSAFASAHHSPAGPGNTCSTLPLTTISTAPSRGK